jgi:hypothetical protein
LKCPHKEKRGISVSVALAPPTGETWLFSPAPAGREMVWSGKRVL